MNSNTEHKQVKTYYKDDQIFVDEMLQGLIQFFFDNDIYTVNSCQNINGGKVWIEFFYYDWFKIIQVAYKLNLSHEHELYYFAQENCNVNLHANDDGYLDEANDEWVEGNEIMWTASIRFPAPLLSKFEELIRNVVSHKEFSTES